MFGRPSPRTGPPLQGQVLSWRRTGCGKLTRPEHLRVIVQRKRKSQYPFLPETWIALPTGDYRLNFRWLTSLHVRPFGPGECPVIKPAIAGCRGMQSFIEQHDRVPLRSPAIVNVSNSRNRTRRRRCAAPSEILVIAAAKHFAQNPRPFTTRRPTSSSGCNRTQSAAAARCFALLHHTGPREQAVRRLIAQEHGLSRMWEWIGEIRAVRQPRI